jgi:pSer/pThr/pTyr-binding forkhead associated (FHA) protein
MSLKSWVLERVHRMNGLVSRVDLPPHDDTLVEPQRTLQAEATVPPHGRAEMMLPTAEHLGPYAALIEAVRGELEHFIVSQVRLHLAIADHDRFVLTSIGVRCGANDEARHTLSQFMREFRPEQVKRYLAREVIAALPNAAAIDLSQFAGLADLDAHEDAGHDYRDLLAELADTRPSADGPAFEVTLLGRWSELDLWPPAGTPSRGTPPIPAPLTPLAGQRCEFDLEDAGGRRRVVLQAVVPGRRYVVGKGEGCDICVSGTYTSRRHAEIWMDKGEWWVGDAGSTNGIRVEPTASSPDRLSSVGSPGAGEAPTRLGDGARLVLSARGEGPAADFPWIALRTGAHASSRLTPIASASPKTPLTVIRSTPQPDALALTTVHAGGTSTLALRPDAPPVSVGRSRNQTVVIDRRHDAVSGHHLDIVALDDASVSVHVHGDNGVVVEGVLHPAGTRLRWKPGETLVLDAGAGSEPACRLVLVKR